MSGTAEMLAGNLTPLCIVLASRSLFCPCLFLFAPCFLGSMVSDPLQLALSSGSCLCCVRWCSCVCLLLSSSLVRIGSIDIPFCFPVSFSLLPSPSPSLCGQVVKVAPVLSISISPRICGRMLLVTARLRVLLALCGCPQCSPASVYRCPVIRRDRDRGWPHSHGGHEERYTYLVRMK